MSHRLRILLVTDSELLAYQLTSALLDRAEITFVLTPGEALARVARGERYHLVLCSCDAPTALSLHAAICRRNAKLAGNMLIFDSRQIRQVIEMARSLDVGHRSGHDGSARACSSQV